MALARHSASRPPPGWTAVAARLWVRAAVKDPGRRMVYEPARSALSSWWLDDTIGAITVPFGWVQGGHRRRLAPTSVVDSCYPVRLG
jgi:hypothetical protein